MTPEITSAFFVHTITEVLAVACMYSLWMMLLKRELNVPGLKRFAEWGLFFVLTSWLSGAYYYVFYYGYSAKQAINSSLYSWYINFIFGVKEYLFLFLPFLLAAAFIVVVIFASSLSQREEIKKSLIYIVGTMTILGIAMILSGVVISGVV